MSSTNTASDELSQILAEFCNDERSFLNIERVKDFLTKVSEDLRYDLLSAINGDYGNTVLRGAAGRGQTELCVTLLSSLPPADRLKLILVDKYTALHLAAWLGYTETVSGILSCLTDDQQLQLLCTQNNHGDTALHIAARERHTEIVNTLLDNITPEQQLQLLFTQNKNSDTALHDAACEGRTETVRSLLEKLTPEQQLKLLSVQNKESNTALHHAAQWGRTETVKTVLENLTPEQQLQLLSVQNKKGITAGFYTNSDTMRTLEHYQKEAEYGVKYPLHYAVKQGDKSSVKSLLDSLTPEQQLQFLSTKDKKDESGKTAVQRAPADERKEIDKMLRQYMSEADFEVNYESLLIENTKSQLHPMIRKLCKKIKTQTAQLVKTQRQNSQLLAINNSLSQTHTDIGLLLTERQESDGDRKIVAEVRALLDENNVAMSEMVIESDQEITSDVGADKWPEYGTSVDSLSLLSLDSNASAAPSVYTKYSKGSKWSHAKPEPLSTDVPPTTHDQSSNTPAVETTNQATQYDVPNTTQNFNGGVEQEQPVPIHSASYFPVPRPRLSLSTAAPVSSEPAGGSPSSVETVRSPTQPSSSAVEATAAAVYQLVFVPTLQNGTQEVSQQPVSTITQVSISPDRPRDDNLASLFQTIEEQPSPAATNPSTIYAAQYDGPASPLQIEAERDRAHPPSFTAAQPSFPVLQPAEEWPTPQVSGRRLSLNYMQGQLQSNQQADSRNNQPSFIITQASIPVDQPADDNSSLSVARARQPNSSDLLESTDSQQPADMSASLNDHQDAYGPSAGTQHQSLQDSEQPPLAHTQAHLQYHQLDNSGNNQPSSTVTQASIQVDQPADDKFSLTSARQPDSNHLLQSTEGQQPADMSASLNDHQGDNQPPSTIPLQSREDAQQPHDDIGSI